MRNTNNCLRRNRKILKELCDQQLQRVNRWELANRGFKFGYCTHVKQTQKRPVHYCYDMAYYEKKGEVFVEAESK